MWRVVLLINLVDISSWDEGEDCGPSWTFLQAAFLVEVQGLVPMPAMISQLSQLLVPTGFEPSWCDQQRCVVVRNDLVDLLI